MGKPPQLRGGLIEPMKGQKADNKIKKKIINTVSYCEFIVVVVVALLFYVHGKHLRSCRDGQLT